MSSSAKFKEKMIDECTLFLVLFIQKRKKIMELVSIRMAHPPYLPFQNVNDDSR